jgi:predicted transcriptional regulator
MYKSYGLRLKLHTSLVEEILTIVLEKGTMNVNDLKNILNVDETRLRKLINFLVKFGFLEFNETEGRITLASNTKTLLEEDQTVEEL